ncbi:MAG: hydrolase [Firmicutes bacterium]|nr:hydrolase [Bacillota bacterium]
MSTSRLTRENCVLIAIDYQEKLVPAMYEKEALIDKSARLIKGFSILGMPVVVTEQYPKGLGSTIPEIKEADPYAEIIEKNTFSAWDNEECVEYIRKMKKPNAVVVGIETHVCEQQTVLAMLEEGFNVYVAADCVSSRSAFDRDISIERMRAAGAIITTYESILFDILQWSKAEEFKQISALVK